MTTLLIENPTGLNHRTPMGHPEQVARLEVVTRALAAPEFEGLARIEARAATEAELRLAHPQDYIDAIREAEPASGTVSLDPDTHMSPGSVEAALRGAGGVVQAVEAVLSGDAGNAFVATRPPGHHAERTRAMGFCLFSNAAIAARAALEVHGLERVAVVDFDVHHGNGTQDVLWDEPRALFVSTHQVPLYPGTGLASETGGSGNVMNLPLEPGSGGARMRQVYEREVFPRLRDFGPELLIVSAGFDAHADDPLAQLSWVEEDFAWITHELCGLASDLCGGRLVSTLEGGYDLPALAASVAAHVKGLMEGRA